MRAPVCTLLPRGPRRKLAVAPRTSADAGAGIDFATALDDDACGCRHHPGRPKIRRMNPKLRNHSIYVSGKFPALQKDEIGAYLVAQGARYSESKSAAGAYLCADPGDPKLVATGKPLFTLDDLGPPLAKYIERLTAAIDHQRTGTYKRDNLLCHLGHGPPANKALITRVEAALGFPVPADLLALMRQFNGLSLAVAKLKKGAKLELGDKVLPYAALADMKHPLWTAPVTQVLAAIGIPTWEDIFLRPQAQRICDHGSSYAPKDVIKIGALKVKAGDFFPHLFAFDLFHHYHGAALYADPKDKQLKVIYAHDYWADLTGDHPISLRTYAESLIAGIWGADWNVGQRLIRPVSKTAWPTYIRNIKGSPYIFLDLK